VTPPPGAASFNASTVLNTPAAITLQPSGIFTGVEIVTGPSNGTVGLAGLIATYTPATGFTGADSFTYRAVGPGGVSAPATVSINVAGATPRFDNTALRWDSTGFTFDRTI
jgi:hypothetical protein